MIFILSLRFPGNACRNVYSFLLTLRHQQQRVDDLLEYGQIFREMLGTLGHSAMTRCHSFANDASKLHCTLCTSPSHTHTAAQKKFPHPHIPARLVPPNKQHDTEKIAQHTQKNSWLGTSKQRAHIRYTCTQILLLSYCIDKHTYVISKY